MNFLDWLSARSRLTLALLTLGALLITAAITCALMLSPGASGQTAAQRSMLPRGALLELTTRYALCGHAEVSTEALVCPDKGVNRSGLEALYASWQVTAFSPDGAALSRTLDAPCPRHCLVRLYGERLAISRMQQGELRELGSATVVREALDPELLSRLDAGYLVDTLAQAEALAEGLSS